MDWCCFGLDLGCCFGVVFLALFCLCSVLCCPCFPPLLHARPSRATPATHTYTKRAPAPLPHSANPRAPASSSGASDCPTTMSAIFLSLLSCAKWRMRVSTTESSAASRAAPSRTSQSCCCCWALLMCVCVLVCVCLVGLGVWRAEGEPPASRAALAALLALGAAAPIAAFSHTNTAKQTQTHPQTHNTQHITFSHREDLLRRRALGRVELEQPLHAVLRGVADARPRLRLEVDGALEDPVVRWWWWCSGVVIAAGLDCASRQNISSKPACLPACPACLPAYLPACLPCTLTPAYTRIHTTNTMMAGTRFRSSPCS